MNFLQICQRLRRESGLTSAASVSPTTVVSQTGELADIVNWASSAYTDLQTSKRDWRWLRSTFSFPTVAGTDSYAYTAATDGQTSSTITRFARWIYEDPRSIKCYLTSAGVAGERWLTYLDWATFRDRFKKGTQTNSAPLFFTIDPQNKIVLGPKPDAVYTISGEYQMSAQTLAADSDTPEMPTDYHMLIVWRALLDYAGANAAPEAYERAQLKARPLETGLAIDQLPSLQFA